jgi:hypothetical protein
MWPKGSWNWIRERREEERGREGDKRKEREEEGRKGLGYLIYETTE